MEGRSVSGRVDRWRLALGWREGCVKLLEVGSSNDGGERWEWLNLG